MNMLWEAKRENRRGGHVAMCVTPYMPQGGLPAQARERKPWMCVFHDDTPNGPKPFVAFGGKVGMESAVEAYLGPLDKN